MGQLDKNRPNDLYGDGNTGGYTYTVDIADGESDIVKLSPAGRGMSLGVAILVCATGTARIDTTFDSHEMINLGTAVWIAWDKGEITGTEMDTFILKPTAIRAVSISGAITFKLSL